MNLHRTLVISSNVFREVIRDRALYLLGFFAAVMIAAVVMVPEVAASTEDQIILDIGAATISLLGLAVAVFVGTGLVNKEIEKRTVYVMVAKSISRTEFIVGKHWGLSAVIGVLVAAMTAIYMSILSINHIAYPAASLALSALFQFLELSLVVAVAILFGVSTSSLLATLITFAVYLSGHLSRDLLNLSNITENAGLKRTIEGMYLVLPDLARFDLKNQAIYSVDLLPQPLELLGNAVYGLVYIALLLTMAIVIFSRRQF